MFRPGFFEIPPICASLNTEKDTLDIHNQRSASIEYDTQRSYLLLKGT